MLNKRHINSVVNYVPLLCATKSFRALGTFQKYTSVAGKENYSRLTVRTLKYNQKTVFRLQLQTREAVFIYGFYFLNQYFPSKENWP